MLKLTKPTDTSQKMVIFGDLSSTEAALTMAAAIFFFFTFFINKWMKFETKLPPGPKTLPIIGNLHLISSPPYHCFRELADRYGPIMYLKLGESPVVVVTSPDIAKEMLKDLDPSFAGRPQGVAMEIMWYGYQSIAFCPYGDYWRQMRKICINELLSPRMVRSFRSIRRDEAARLVDSLRESFGSSVNLTDKIFTFSNSITCRTAFGGVCNDREGFIKVMMETLRMAGGFEIEDIFPSSRIVKALSWSKTRLMKMRSKLDAILDDVIDEHRENLSKMVAQEIPGDSGRRSGNGEFGGEDLVDVLLRMKEGGAEELKIPIDGDKIKASSRDMFSAGTETSSSLIDWAMVELMRNPNVMAKAQAEVRQVLKSGTTLDEDDVHKLKYLKLVVKEVLRLHPPIPMVPRASREVQEIKGYVIPAGVKVMVNIWAMHRDPSFWKDPERFEPKRFENQALEFTGGDFQFLPFGSGRRMCPGITYGLSIVELALAQLLYNFDWKLPEGVRPEDLDMVENDGLTASRKDKLFVVATPYQP
ncbi:premnaspirodiene oxygenase-like [Salvia miltiorrhiza]|uniref:premnaspirodiene oxygenase-like n=1 Tax=Salvia miltiorrhiza TaxID=226208 RepID=UPI0025AC0AAA|nr:premnaspirodiene oxygenase-like [Salvia miltiorrhiza]